MKARILVVALLFIAACSTLKQSDPEREVRDFMVNFHKSLSGNELEILRHFETDIPAKGLLELIAILQNKDKNITCSLDFANPVIEFNEDAIKVVVMGSFFNKADDPEEEKQIECQLRLRVNSKEDSFVISKVENGFYYTFVNIGRERELEKIIKSEEEKRSIAIKTALELEQKFDSVIWYSTDESKNYFYVVSGKWQNYFLDHNSRNEVHVNNESMMGLVDAKGDTIIPIAYTSVGTISFDHGGIVEVRKGDKFGYYNVRTKRNLIDTLYDVIIPYFEENVSVIVKQDSTFGWYNDLYEYSDGFPSEEIESWVLDAKYLNRKIRLARGSHAFAEVPDLNYAGNGIVIFPSYLTSLGIFPAIESGISTTTEPINGWTAYIEKSPSVLTGIGNKFKAIFTTLREEYLESREGFYEETAITIVDADNENLPSQIVQGGVIQIRAVDSTLFEILKEPAYDHYFSDIESDWIPVYDYFKLENKKLVPQSSKRFFSQTEFVKMDSSYLIWTPRTENIPKPLSAKTLLSMRNEILFDYGYEFKEEDRADFFTRNENYNPKYKTVDEIIPLLTEIDRHNLDLLIAAIENQKQPI